MTGGVNGVLYADTKHGGTQLGIQLYAITFSVFWSLILTFFIVLLVDFKMGMRVSEEEEEVGLDHSLHGETLIVKTSEQMKVTTALEERRSGSTIVDMTNHSSTVQMISLSTPVVMEGEP